MIKDGIVISKFSVRVNRNCLFSYFPKYQLKVSLLAKFDLFVYLFVRVLIGNSRLPNA